MSDLYDLTSKFDPKYTAHICVDVQSGYCDPNHPATQDRLEATFKNAALSGRIKLFSEELRNINLTNIWVVHALEKIMSIPEDPMWGASSRGKKKWAKSSLFGVCAANNEPIVLKEKLSALDGTNLSNLLKSHAKSRVIISGLYLHECLDATAIDLAKEGVETYIISDLIAAPKSKESSTKERFLYLYEEYGIKSTTSENILDI